MAKIAGKSLVFKIGSPLATIGIFDPNLNETADEIDVTDSESGDDREWLAGFESKEFSFAQWFSDSATPLENGDTQAFSWKIGAKTVTGTLVITGRTLGATREDAHRFDYKCRVTGAVTIA